METYEGIILEDFPERKRYAYKEYIEQKYYVLWAHGTESYSFSAEELAGKDWIIGNKLTGAEALAWRLKKGI